MLTTLILGAALAEYGLTGLQHDDGTAFTPEGQASAAVEQIVPISGYRPPPGMVIASNAGIEQDVAVGVTRLDSSFRKIPGYAVKMAEQVEKHGINALAYEDPEMKSTGREIGLEVGAGIRHFAIALGKDLVSAARGAGMTNKVN
ncbi:hypothetical protein [Sulfuricystis multivorans]|uniref:hypothetical protein n=1 Tax=Sulfuricystis multivorans TaxID=2211108 RepID=UPI000F82F1D6|nr:hypothetical protein [Sulfuricystis multivorans]